MNSEAIEELFDFYELKDIELADGSIGSVKEKIGTFKKSQLEANKLKLNEQVAEIDLKITEIDKL